MTEYAPQLHLDHSPEDIPVDWYPSELKVIEGKRRARLFGKKLLTYYPVPRFQKGRLGISSLPSSQITDDMIHDPDLRYALRFQAAAKSDDRIPEVSIYAEGEDGDSKFLKADYDGSPGEFEEALRVVARDGKNY